MRAFKIIILVVLTSCFVASTVASSFEDASGAYRKGDYATALRLIRPLADQGEAAAQHNLGLMYSNGQGVPQDFNTALKWFRKAADQGFGPAQINLGYMYANGQGVPQDYVYAHVWFNLAATTGNQDAISNRDFIQNHMTPAQIAEAQKLAREWKPTE